MREFNLISRDFYPVLPMLDLTKPCQVVARSGTPPERRAAPVFFAVDPAVAEPAREHRIRFECFAKARLGASFVVSVPSGSVLTDGFFTADRGGNLLSDSFRAYGMVARYGFRELGERRFERGFSGTQALAGTALVVGVQTNANYFHWLMEALPRLWLAERVVGLERTSVLVPALAPWMADMAAACGLGPERLIVPDAEDTCWERLIVPARGLWNIHTFTWHAFALVDGLRAGMSPGPDSGRFFVSRARSASRRIENEDEVFEIAAQHGFERVFPEELSFNEQVSLFGRAEAVAGALGAGLANAVFMRPGGKLLEFAPEQREGDSVLFANLAHHRKLRYAGVVGRLTEGQQRPVDRRDFRISPRTAADAFAALCAS